MSEASGDTLVCADCGRAIPWRSDEAGEWPAVTDGGSFKTVCLDCYQSRYGEDEADQLGEAIRREQADERGPDDAEASQE